VRSPCHSLAAPLARALVPACLPACLCVRRCINTSTPASTTPTTDSLLTHVHRRATTNPTNNHTQRVLSLVMVRSIWQAILSRDIAAAESILASDKRAANTRILDCTTTASSSSSSSISASNSPASVSSTLAFSPPTTSGFELPPASLSSPSSSSSSGVASTTDAGESNKWIKTKSKRSAPHLGTQGAGVSTATASSSSASTQRQRTGASISTLTQLLESTQPQLQGQPSRSSTHDDQSQCPEGGAAAASSTALATTPSSRWSMASSPDISPSLSASPHYYNATSTPKQWGRFTPLHLASALGHREMVRTLLRHGASVDAKDSRGWSSLHWASCCLHLDVVLELLRSSNSNAYTLASDRRTTPMLLLSESAMLLLARSSALTRTERQSIEPDSSSDSSEPLHSRQKQKRHRHHRQQAHQSTQHDDWVSVHTARSLNVFESIRSSTDSDSDTGDAALQSPTSLVYKRHLYSWGSHLLQPPTTRWID